MGILIYGAGGHGQVVADILLRARRSLTGFVDDDPAKVGYPLMGLPVLAPIFSDTSEIIVAIGDNRIRAEIYQRLVQEKLVLVSAIHRSTIVDRKLPFRPGCVFCAGAIVGIGCQMGENVILNTAATVDHHCTIGPHVHIAPGAHLAGYVTVGEGTLVGMGALVLPGVTIGQWCVIAAGSIIKHDLPDYVQTYVSGAAYIIRRRG